MSLLSTLKLFLTKSVKRFLCLHLGRLPCCSFPLKNCLASLTSSILVSCPTQRISLCLRGFSMLDELAFWRTMVSGIRDCHLMFTINFMESFINFDVMLIYSPGLHIYIYIYIYIYTYLFIYIYVCVCVCVCTCNIYWMSFYMPLF